MPIECKFKRDFEHFKNINQAEKKLSDHRKKFIKFHRIAKITLETIEINRFFTASFIHQEGFKILFEK